MNSEPTQNTTHHLLIRYSDNFAPPSGTIAEHKKVIKECGCVWMGKFGRPIGKDIVEKITHQIKEGTPTYLFLSSHSVNTGYFVSVGSVNQFVKTLPDDEINFVPEYYRNKLSQIKSWFRLDRIKKVDSGVLSVLRGNASGLPIRESMAGSTTGHLIVLADKGFDISRYFINNKKP